MGILQRYCAYQDRCRSEIVERLKENEVPVAEHDTYISLLEEQGFLDETRYARIFARGHFRKNKWGRLKISQALRQKGISDRNISLALEEIEDQYQDALFLLLEKKISQIKNREDRNKTWQQLTRFALQKGYESPAIYDCLRRLMGKSP